MSLYGCGFGNSICVSEIVSLCRFMLNSAVSWCGSAVLSNEQLKVRSLFVMSVTWTCLGGLR